MNKILFVALIYIPFISFSQGQSPNSVKWKEINTEYAQIIFPEELSEQAQKSANLINRLYTDETKTLITKPKKVPIILYNQSTVSNGFAGLRPRRSVWFSTPSQYAADLGTNDWIYTLAVHEYRHIVQYSKSNRYFTKFLSTTLGQTGLLIGEYSIPYWFFEGDAVCTETSLTQGGRGRIAQFDMPIRTILQNDKKISYDVAKLGSYKTFFPSYYHLGYLLTSEARVMFGSDIWDKTLTHTSKISFWPFAFSRGLKKTTGLNEKQLYEKVMNHLDTVWDDRKSKTTMKNVEIINKAEKKSWTKYTEAEYLNENQIIAKKSSLKSDITSFYIIDKTGKETKLKATDAGMISSATDKIVWDRKYSDPRWQVRDYSDIIIFDINTKKEKRLTKKQKLFAPALSPDGKKTAAVQYDTKMNSSIVVLNSETGETIETYTNFSGDFLRTPSWNIEGNKIVFTRTNEIGTAPAILDTETGIVQNLTEYSDENIGRPVFYKNFILYNSPYNGIGNIYAIKIDTGDKFQITSETYGAYNPKVLNNNLLYIRYDINGYDIAQTVLNETLFTPLNEVSKYTFKTAEILQQQEQGKNVLHPDIIENKTFPISKYKKNKHALNIHSWGLTTNYPTTFDASFRPKIGADIYSANVLNTVFGVAGIRFNTDTRTFGSKVSLILKKFYPQFDITSEWEQRETGVSTANNSFGMTLPLNLSKGIHYKGLNLGARFLNSYIVYDVNDYFIPTNSFSAFSLSGSIYKFRWQANQDINPKFGHFLYASYSQTPNQSIYQGSQLTVSGSLYLPGIIEHHSINIKAGFEEQTSNIFQNIFSNQISYPRGHLFYSYLKISKISADYSFPVWYPDINIGSLLFVKRLRANFYYDYANVNYPIFSDTYNFQSAGAELIFQVYFFRLGEPIEIGGRISYITEGNILNTTGRFSPEFIVLNIPF